jgi:hypothetical protein
MSTPTLKNSDLECTDPSGAELHFTLKGQISRSQTDQVDAADNGQQYVADPEAVRVAEARINQAAAVIRSLRDKRLRDFVPRFSPSADSNLRQSETDKQPNTSPALEDNDFTETQPRFLSRLDPEIAPDPPTSVRPLNLGPILFRFSLMTMLAAIVAYAITMFPSFQQRATFSSKGAKDGVTSLGRREAASERPQLSRLVLENQQAFANEPVALGVSVAPAIGFGSILVSGLTPGTRLSAGTPVTSASWELPLDNIGGVRVYAPPNFVGVMNTVIDLLAPTKKVIDRRAERLEWIAKADSLQPRKETGPEGARGAVTKPIDPHDAVALMERGRELLKNGDIALAQLAFRRLADAGRADGAFALANTYDPRYLAKHNLIDIAGDETKAQLWYRRASELGSAEADQILARTDSK